MFNTNNAHGILQDATFRYKNWEFNDDNRISLYSIDLDSQLWLLRLHFARPEEANGDKFTHIKDHLQENESNLEFPRWYNFIVNIGGYPLGRYINTCFPEYCMSRGTH